MRKNSNSEEYQAGYDYGYALAYASEKELRPNDEEVKSYYNGEKSCYNTGVVDGLEEANRLRFDESYEYAEQMEDYNAYLEWEKDKQRETARVEAIKKQELENPLWEFAMSMEEYEQAMQ